VAFCTYTAVNALLTVQALAGTTDALNTRIEQQSGQISQYEQEIGELEQDQP
jgi:cell division protein FtsL